MKGKQSKRKKKALTLDRFAVMIQQDLARMATKDDLARFATKDDLIELSQKMVTREEFRNLHSDIQMITESMVTKADLANTLAAELEKFTLARQVAGLDQRVHVIEKKLGIKQFHRTA